MGLDDEKISRKFPPDAQYLMNAVAMPLQKALAEIVLKQPQDPVDYLANWLYKHAGVSLADREKDKLATRVAAEAAARQQAEEERAAMEAEQRDVEAQNAIFASQGYPEEPQESARPPDAVEAFQEQENAGAGAIEEIPQRSPEKSMVMDGKQPSFVRGASNLQAAEVDEPAAEMEAPAAGNEAPAAENEAPAAENEAPAAELEAPPAELELPPAEMEAPAVEIEAPAADSENLQPRTPTKTPGPNEMPQVEIDQGSPQVSARPEEVPVAESMEEVAASAPPTDEAAPALDADQVVEAPPEEGPPSAVSENAAPPIEVPETVEPGPETAGSMPPAEPEPAEAPLEEQAPPAEEAPAPAADEAPPAEAPPTEDAPADASAREAGATGSRPGSHRVTFAEPEPEGGEAEAPPPPADDAPAEEPPAE